MNETANIERLRQIIEARHQLVVTNFLEVAKACHQAERELTKAGLESLGSVLSFGPIKFSKLRRVGADARLVSNRVLPLLPAHSLSSLYEVSGWSDDKLEAAISQKVLNPTATRRILEQFGKSKPGSKKTPAYIAYVPACSPERIDDFLHELGDVCRRYDVDLQLPFDEVFHRDWDRREAKILTFLRKRVRKAVSKRKRDIAAQNKEWGFFEEETAVDRTHDRNQIRLVMHIIGQEDLFEEWLSKAEGVYPMPEYKFPEPHPIKEARRLPAKRFGRSRNPQSVEFHQVGNAEANSSSVGETNGTERDATAVAVS